MFFKMIRISGTPIDIVALSEMQKCGLKYVMQTLPELERSTEKAEPKLRSILG